MNTFSSSRKPRILITNDDGFSAPGIRVLWEELCDWADVTIVAPAHDQSSTSLSLSIRNVLQPRYYEWDGRPVWSVDGTPADCVKLGLADLLREPPDLVASGINKGSNAGRNVLYSGTVGGAIEAALRGIPGVAYSAMCHINPDFEICRPYIRKIAEYALSHPLPAGTIWNANFPAEAEGGACKIRLARQGRQLWRESPHKRPVPDTNQHYYWMGGVLTDCQEGENSDVHYLRQGFATLAPIHIDDLTHHEELQKRQEHFSQLFPDPGAGHA